jgi:diaminohydroxyphosphoribosylaminopyrimidine deaminase/5-amino-6-(5-phosphoribosylamino)uracil reductase
MVVTLEPCNHYGRTPPCTEAILEAGISRVVIGAGDPDTRVAGSGRTRLEEAGVDVTTGVHADAAEALDAGYFHHRRTGRPLVTLKSAITLDGQAAAADGTSQWITSAEARRDAHLLRSRSDAVMVGAGTMRLDDPALTVRLEGFTANQPQPVIVAGSGGLPEAARIWERKPLVYGSVDEMPIPAGEYISVPGPDGADIGAVIKDLGARGFIDLLVEGGPTLARSLLDARAIDRVVAYIAGRLGGGTGRPMIGGTWGTLDSSHTLRITDTAAVGSDIRVTADVLHGEDA